MFDRMKLSGFLAAGALVAGLSVGAADASTFTFNSNGGNGTAVDNGPVGAYDFALTLTSNNNNSCCIFTTATATAAESLQVTGVWQYSTNDVDGSSFDPFGYFIDSVYVGLVQLSTNGDPAPAFQSGTFSFTVSGGQDWGFYIYATDGIYGSSTGVAYGDIAPVPLPAAGFLLVGALGGLGALRRRKGAAA